jgi:Fur family peroxide stress response transcriptional regulator
MLSGAGKDPARVLREAGLRVTPQRLAIVRQVLGSNHPTAGEIYEAVHREFPTIGLGTVYATLNTMNERGLLSVLPVVDAVRFDANVAPHANLICTQCGSIVDFEDCDDMLEQLRLRTSHGAERLDVYGVCSACAV